MSTVMEYKCPCCGAGVIWGKYAEIDLRILR